MQTAQNLATNINPIDMVEIEIRKVRKNSYVYFYHCS